MENQVKNPPGDVQPDIGGEQLNERRFQMLEDIAHELSGESVVFPVCFDLAMRIRRTLQDENVSTDKIVAQVSLEPLIGAKLMQLANSVAFNASGVEVRDMKAAINRLGLEMVRGVAMATTMNQMVRSRGLESFDEVAKHLWLHTLKTASACWVIAQKMNRRINPDEALFAGLVHDLGAFYMLYRASQYEELRARPDTLKYLIAQWHESIGVTLLGVLEMPEEIIEAVRDHDVLRPPPQPRALKDVVYMGNMLAGGLFEWIQLDIDQETAENYDPGESYRQLKDEIDAHLQEMLAIFGN